MLGNVHTAYANPFRWLKKPREMAKHSQEWSEQGANVQTQGLKMAQKGE